MIPRLHISELSDANMIHSALDAQQQWFELQLASSLSEADAAKFKDQARQHAELGNAVTAEILRLSKGPELVYANEESEEKDWNPGLGHYVDCDTECRSTTAFPDDTHYRTEQDCCEVYATEKRMP
jgi:hypothetical protein